MKEGALGATNRLFCRLLNSYAVEERHLPSFKVINGLEERSERKDIVCKGLPFTMQTVHKVVNEDARGFRKVFPGV